jgi:hypothetical protein
VAAQPPAELVRESDDPVVLPEKALGAGEITRYWGKDRISLRVCKVRHIGLRDFYSRRDTGLAGQ